MDKVKSIEVLNTLLEINNDRIEGYTSASNETEEEELVSLFREFAMTSQKCKEELETEIKNIEGEPLLDTQTPGKFFRVWMSLKTALTEKDRREILNSCESAEDQAIDTYKKVMQDDYKNLSELQLSLIKEQSVAIITDIKKLISLRSELVETI